MRETKLVLLLLGVQPIQLALAPSSLSAGGGRNFFEKRLISVDLSGRIQHLFKKGRLSAYGPS